MMRVLVNGLSARLGGGKTYLANLLKYAPQEQGCQVFLLCQDTFDVAGLPESIRRLPTPRVLENPLARAAWENLYLGKLVRDLGIDLLFCPGGLLPTCRLAGGVKTAVTFQNMLPFDHQQRQRYPLGYRRWRDWMLEKGFSNSLRQADLVIFISQFARELIAARLGKLPGAQAVIPHGVERRFFPDPPAPPPVGIPNDGGYFLYVSFIDYYKNQLEVVRAFSRLRQLEKTNASLWLAGAENPGYGRLLRQEIARLGLEKKVALLGNVPHDELPALYQHARLNMFASSTENCPNILLEMMAAGRPAMVSNRPPMPEFGSDSVTYFNPGDIEQLATIWAALLNRPEPAEALAKAARRRASAMTWETAAEATWAALAATARGMA